MESYEQKYKEALGWMKSLYGGLHGKTKEEAEKYFPELAESEDERIRKELIEHIKANECADYVLFQKFSPDNVIAWLEKQGEQETDEWKEGNIIRHGGILALVIRGRRVMKSNGEIFTVQYPDEWVKAAPKEIEHFLNEFEKQGEPKQEENDQKSEPFRIKKGKWYVCIHDFCHNGIRIGEIIQAEHDDTIRGIGFLYMENKYFRPAFENEITQKSKWSEEDEERLQSCIIELQGKGLMGGVDTIDTKWLKSLKQRMEE